MNRIILRVIGSLVLGTALSPQAYAVVPSPVSLEEANQLNEEGIAKSTSSKSVSQVADKLAEDQRRLESVQQDLKEDQKALKQAESKERPDGHSLH